MTRWQNTPPRRIDESIGTFCVRSDFDLEMCWSDMLDPIPAFQEFQTRYRASGKPHDREAYSTFAARIASRVADRWYTLYHLVPQGHAQPVVVMHDSLWPVVVPFAGLVEYVYENAHASLRRPVAFDGVLLAAPTTPNAQSSYARYALELDLQNGLGYVVAQNQRT